MTQYVRPGESSAETPDVVKINAPKPVDIVDNTIILANSTTTSTTVQQEVAYHHRQNTTSNTWIINHNLGFYPNVTVVDSGGTIVEGEIAYTTRNSLTTTFSAAFSGHAYLS